MAQIGDSSLGRHHPTIAAHDGQLDGKSLNANEFYADESGRVYDDENVSIERIEKVYR